MNWKAKASVQKLIGIMPGRHRLNLLFQRHVTHTLDLHRDVVVEHLEIDIAQVRALEEAGLRREGFAAFELGTGWYPLWPIVMFLAGAGRIVTADRARLMSLEQAKDAVAHVVALIEDGTLARMMPMASRERTELLKQLHTQSPGTLEELLASLHVEYRTGGDAFAGLTDGTFDLVGTVGVIQYIDRPALDQLMARMTQILRDDGVMVHHNDLRDQFAVHDPSIGKLNFLRYSEWQWRLIRNAIIPSNRLRLEAYREIFGRAGLDETTIWLETLDDAEVLRTPRHTSFAGCDVDGLRAGIVRHVARKKLARA